jgi:hypothetical protein
VDKYERKERRGMRLAIGALMMQRIIDTTDMSADSLAQEAEYAVKAADALIAEVEATEPEDEADV